MQSRRSIFAALGGLCGWLLSSILSSRPVQAASGPLIIHDKKLLALRKEVAHPILKDWASFQTADLWFPRDFPHQVTIDSKGRERFVFLNGSMAIWNSDNPPPSISVAYRDGKWYRLGKRVFGGYGENGWAWPAIVIDDPIWVTQLNKRFAYRMAA